MHYNQYIAWNTENIKFVTLCSWEQVSRIVELVTIFNAW